MKIQTQPTKEACMNINQCELTQRFTHYIVPVEIFNCNELSHFNKFLLVLIDSYHDENHGGCIATNAFLADKLNSEVNTVAKGLVKLRKLGWLEDVDSNKDYRIIRTLINKKIDQKQSSTDQSQKNFKGLDKRPRGLDKNPSGVGQTSKGYPPSPYRSNNNIYINNNREYIDPPPNSPPKASPPSLSKNNLKFGEIVQMPIQKYESLCTKHGKQKVDEVLASMDDYCLSKGTSYKDYSAALRQWLRNEEKWANQKSQRKEQKNAHLQESNKEYAKQVTTAFQKLSRGKPKFVEVENYPDQFTILTTVGQKPPTGIRYTEYGFKEQVNNALRRWGLGSLVGRTDAVCA